MKIFLPVLVALFCTWYGGRFVGRPTASGEIYDPSAMTCASNRFPLGTRLRVSYGGRSVLVRVNDRMNRRFPDRVDLSPAAFRLLAPLAAGIIEATVEKIP